MARINFFTIFDVCTLDPVSVNFEFFSENGGSDGKLLLSVESGDEYRVTSMSQMKLPVKGSIGSKYIQFLQKYFNESYHL